MDSQKRPRGRPKSRFKESSAGTLQALDRALVVLVTVARLGRVTLSDLARMTQIPTATTHRILTTLQGHGFLDLEETQQEWVVGIEAYRTGAAFLRRNSVVEAGRPVMQRLMESTGETANMALPVQTEVVFVGQIETNHPIRAMFPPGTRTSMHASGIGKALLSAMPEAEVLKMLTQMELTRFTDHTLDTTDALLRDLRQTRTRGWSHDHQERHLGMSCVAAAVFDELGNPCAGISISGPTSRIDGARLEELGAQVADAARTLTRLTGGQPANG